MDVRKYEIRIWNNNMGDNSITNYIREYLITNLIPESQIITMLFITLYSKCYGYHLVHPCISQKRKFIPHNCYLTTLKLVTHIDVFEQTSIFVAILML